MPPTLIALDDLDPSGTTNVNILSHTPAPTNGFASGWVDSRSAFTGGYTVILNYGGKFNAGTPRSTPLVKIDSSLHQYWEIYCDMYYGDSQPYRMGFMMGMDNTPSHSSEGPAWLELQADVDTNDESVSINCIRNGGGFGGPTVIGHRNTSLVVGPGWGFRWGITSDGPAATADVSAWWEPFGGGTRTVVGSGNAADSGWTEQSATDRSIGLHFENSGARFQNITVLSLPPHGDGCDDGFDQDVMTDDGDVSTLPIFTFDPAWQA